MSGGEEGKVGTASATPRLPGVSPVVPRIQGGQPPPMQVRDSHEYLGLLCLFATLINRCSTDQLQMLGRPIIGSSAPLGMPSDPLTLNGDVKRKRGRPRTLDGPQDDNACFGPSRVSTVHSSATSLPTSLLRLSNRTTTLGDPITLSLLSLLQSVADKRSEPGELPSLELQRGRGQVEQGHPHLPGHVTSPGSAQQVHQYFFILELESTCPSHFFNLLIRNLLAQDIN